MIFTKVPYAANFDFANKFVSEKNEILIGTETYQVNISSFEGDIHHIQISHPDKWSEDLNLVAMNLPEPSKGDTKSDYLNQSLKIDKNFQISLVDAKGEAYFGTEAGLGFGVMSKMAMFAFGYSKDQRFYGLGEKTYGRLELSHVRSRFWNTDALADFHFKQWDADACDPYYLSVPYLIVRNGDQYIGLLYHNPYPTWIDTGSDPSFFGTEDQNRKIIIGSEDGLPSLWIIVGPTLAELTCKLQKLVGVTPRPPLWSLGYHQCRWEYKGEKSLLELDKKMSEYEIPNDGLWLDIDYMEGYRVFTYSQDAFPNGVKHVTSTLAKSGRKVVPIIDPGVKIDAKFPMYNEGIEGGHFCLGPQGKPFVGFVWPGETVFPDFSQAKTRTWWAKYAKSFKELGFGGAWVDMNDPSTGCIDPCAMLFSQGKYSHEAFRNQYALGMQMATHDGFQQASPGERIFILSRSGYTGTSRYAAIWTGDNLSNRWYLKGSIPTTLGLSLSGIPFNGPDVGGFMNNTTEPLMVDWMKSGFLFPFFRNHSVGAFRKQEPWTFSKKGMEVIRHYTRMRYKLIPYLYQLFVSNEKEGHSILRPLNYHFSNLDPVPDDMFMVGERILQAPCLEENKGRKLKLPGGEKWFDARNGEWKSGQQTITYSFSETPLYFRDGSIIPALVGESKNNSKNLHDIEMHVFTNKKSAEIEYVFDDGISHEYKSGKESVLKIKANISKGLLTIETEALATGAGAAKVTFMVYGQIRGVVVNGKRTRTRKTRQRWTGDRPIECLSFPLQS